MTPKFPVFVYVRETAPHDIFITNTESKIFKKPQHVYLVYTLKNAQAVVDALKVRFKTTRSIPFNKENMILIDRTVESVSFTKSDFPLYSFLRKPRVRT